MGRLTPPSLLHTHTRMQDKETRHSKMPETSLKVENFSHQECKQKKNCLTPVKLERKNKKIKK